MKKYIILAILPIMFATIQSTDNANQSQAINTINQALSKELQAAQATMNNNTKPEVYSTLHALALYANKNPQNKEIAIASMKAIKNSLENLKTQENKKLSYYSWLFSSNTLIQEINRAIKETDKNITALRSSSYSYLYTIGGISIATLAATMFGAYKFGLFDTHESSGLLDKTEIPKAFDDGSGNTLQSPEQLPIAQPPYTKQDLQSNDPNSFESYQKLISDIQKLESQINEINNKLRFVGTPEQDRKSLRSQLSDLELNLTELQEQLNQHRMNPQPTKPVNLPLNASDHESERQSVIAQFTQRQIIKEAQESAEKATNAAITATKAADTDDNLLDLAEAADEAAEQALTAAKNLQLLNTPEHIQNARQAIIRANKSAEEALNAVKNAQAAEGAQNAYEEACEYLKKPFRADLINALWGLRDSANKAALQAVRNNTNLNPDNYKIARDAAYRIFIDFINQSLGENTGLQESGYHSDSDASSTTYDSDSE